MGADTRQMTLTDEEQAWLAGDAGIARRRAMEIVVALGNIYGAERLIPVSSVQVSGVSYRNIGAAGLTFLQRWAAEGAQVRVPTTLNPTAMDLVDWATQGFSADFAAKQQAIVDTFAAMGVGDGHPLPTCTPYLVGNCPPLGATLAWGESSAVVFANSVLGARTNREGGPGALAAALTGRTAAYGLQLTAARRATLRVTVQTELRSIADYSALGALVGKAAQQAIPYFTALPLALTDPYRQAKLKALGAAMAATGAVGLYHIAEVTPEAPDALAAEFATLTVTTLTLGYAMLNDPNLAVDLVWMGCPHASIAEIAQVAAAVRGKRLRLPLWITCARPIKEAATQQGLTDTLQSAGAHLYADACLAIAPVRELGFTAVATTSAKGAYYLRNLAGVTAHFGDLETCIAAALTGQWGNKL